MSSICDADLQHLKPGKKVSVKSYQGSKYAPENVSTTENYWQLIGAKAVVVTTSDDNSSALIKFDRNLRALNLACPNDQENSLWILVSDLKFVCRY